MKITFPNLFTAAVFCSFSLHAQVSETPVTLGLVDGGNPQGYIRNSSDQGIIFSTAPGGQGQMMPYSRIRGEGLDKLIRYEERVDVLGEPRALFSAGAYEEAATAYGAVARDYAIILNAPQNFATEALFYQMESLLRAGRFRQLAGVVNLPVAATVQTKLDERYHRPFAFYKLWALYGEEKMVELRSAIAEYEELVTGDAKLLNVPNFKKLPPPELAQLSFLRAKALEAEENESAALDDYYRAFTLAYGNDNLLARLAMGAAMVIQSRDPRLEREDKAAVAQMQSVAYLYSRRFGTAGMPPAIQKYAVAPAVAKPSPNAVENVEEPGAAEADAADEDKETEGKKEEE